MSVSSTQRRQRDAISRVLRLLQDQRKQFGSATIKVVKTLRELAHLYGGIGRFARARKLLLQSLCIVENKRGRYDRDVGAVSIDLGQLHLVENDYAAASSMFHRALAIAEIAYGKDDVHTAVALENLAEAYVAVDDLASAISVGRRAFSIRQKTNTLADRDGCRLMRALATWHIRQGRHARAKTLLMRSLRMVRKHRRARAADKASTLWLLGRVHFDMGEYSRAKAIWDELADLVQSKKRETIFDLCPLLDARGEVNFALGFYEEAQALHRQSLMIKIKRHSRNHPGVADSLQSLADVFRAMGMFQDAESYYSESLRIWERSLGPHDLKVRQSCNSLGLLFLDMGHLDRARQYLLQALRIQKPIYGAGHAEVATIYHNLALVFRSFGRTRRAMTLNRHALQMREQSLGKNHPVVAISLQSVAGLHLERKEYAQAELLYRRAFKIIQRTAGTKNSDISRVLNSLGILYLHQQKLLQAKRYFHRSIRTLQDASGKHHPDRQFPLSNLAACYRASRQFNQALDFYAQSLNFENQHIRNVFRVVSSEHQKLQSVLSLSENYDAALSLIVRKFLADAGSVRLGLEWTLSRKGLVWDSAATLNRLRAQNSVSADGNYVALHGLWRQLHQLLVRSPDRLQGGWAAHQKRYRFLQNEIQRIEKIMQPERLHATDLRGRNRTGFSSLCRMIPKATALVEYVKIADWDLDGQRTGDFRYLAFVISAQHQLQLFDLGSDRVIEPLVSQALRAIQSEIGPETSILNHHACRKAHELLQNLHTLLWEPFEYLLGKARNVFISPDGILSLLPFSALRNGSRGTLIQEHAIAYLTSGRELFAGGRKPPRSPTELLLIANPEFGHGAKFPPLPGTVKEARDIPPLLPGAHERKVVLQGRSATKQVVLRANSPRVLHLATHGYFLDESLGTVGNEYEDLLLRSGLALAGANHQLDESWSGEDDGRLTSLEVTGMDLRRTELVVLSACSTGVGEVVKREGVIGLRRAFSIAGARNLMMSLWNISDEESPSQVLGFYKHWQKLPPALALRQAQLESINVLQDDIGFAPVSLWAPFIMQGASAFDQSKNVRFA